MNKAQWEDAIVARVEADRGTADLSEALGIPDSEVDRILEESRKHHLDPDAFAYMWIVEQAEESIKEAKHAPDLTGVLKASDIRPKLNEDNWEVVNQQKGSRTDIYPRGEIVPPRWYPDYLPVELGNMDQFYMDWFTLYRVVPASPSDVWFYQYERTDDPEEA